MKSQLAIFYHEIKPVLGIDSTYWSSWPNEPHGKPQTIYAILLVGLRQTDGEVLLLKTSTQLIEHKELKWCPHGAFTSI